MRSIIAVGVSFLAFALVAGAGSGEGAKLVGVWDVVEGDLPPKGKVEFTKDGKMTMTFKLEDKEITMNGTYKVKKDQITVTFEHDGKTDTKHGTIKKLTATDLVIVNEKDKEMHFKRVAAK
jgi:uncharacterized protein (TIGR03066 family)